MVFVYVLALIGLAVLIVIAVAAIAALSEPSEERATDDPYDAALDAVARLQAAAWTAIHELKDLEK